MIGTSQRMFQVKTRFIGKVAQIIRNRDNFMGNHPGKFETLRKTINNVIGGVDSIK
jgi:hypothetical protein